MKDGGKVTVYTTDPCGFCRQAKALLESRGVDYEEISLTKDPDGRARLVQRTGQMTFPQIIAGARDNPALRPIDPALLRGVSRNAPCPCGSGKKFKHCHGAF